jgi:hypothetical protein
MGSLLERLEQRGQAARTRVEALRAELDALAGRLAAEETLLERLEITRTTVLELLAGDGGDLGEEAVAVPATGVATAPGTAVQVPRFTPDGAVAGQGLPVAYRDVVEVLPRCRPAAAGHAGVPGAGAGRPAAAPGGDAVQAPSGWSSVAGWSRPPRACSPAPRGWRAHWTAPRRPRRGEDEVRGSSS